VKGEGPDHAKRFFATVYLENVAHGTGEGGSKKQAEQAAAWCALGAFAGEQVRGGENAGVA
jgi:dsRNA-specific ribonuclease